MRNVKKKPDDGSTNVACCRVCPETVTKSPITKNTIAQKTVVHINEIVRMEFNEYKKRMLFGIFFSKYSNFV